MPRPKTGVPTRAQILAACHHTEQQALETIRLTSYIRALVGDRPAILASDAAARAAVQLAVHRAPRARKEPKCPPSKTE